MRRLIAGSTAVALVLVVATAAGARAPGGGPGESAGGKRVVRYSGTSEAGLPISFRVVTKDGRTKILGLSVDVLTECWSDTNLDRVQDQLIVHITKLRGKVYPDGTVDVYFAPDDDTEYVVEGKLKKRTAKLNVIVGGRFGADGIPNAGTIDCDNFGARYRTSSVS